MAAAQKTQGHKIADTIVRLKFFYILAAAYSLVAIPYTVLIFVQTGHESNPFDFVFYLNAPACRLLDLFPDVIRTGTALPQILSCLLAGLVQWTLMGGVIDVLLSRFRGR